MAPLVIDQNSSRSPTDVGQIPYKNVGHRSTSSVIELSVLEPLVLEPPVLKPSGAARGRAVAVVVV